MKFKKIVTLLALAAILAVLLLSFTSCGKSVEVDDIRLPKETTANLEFNYYETVNLDKKTFSKFVGSEYFLSDEDAAMFPLEDIESYVRYLVAGKKNDDRIIIFYCKNDKAAREIRGRLEAIKNGSSDYDDYIIGQSVFVDEEYGLSFPFVCMTTEDALTATSERPYLTKVKHTFFDDNNYKYIVKGFGNTMIITLGALVIGVVLGVAFAVAKYYAEGNKKLRWLNAICDVYTTVVRGIPITVLLLIFFFVVFKDSSNGVLIAIIAFGINSGAYMAELVRSGINAVDSGQMEAARSLGMSKWQAMRTIIFPQAIKNVLPAIGNECIALLKETSVAGYVAVVDLTRGANVIKNLTYDPFHPLILSALIYLGLVVLMTWLLTKLERRLAKSERRTSK